VRSIPGTPTVGLQSGPPSPPRRQQWVTVALARGETATGSLVASKEAIGDE